MRFTVNIQRYYPEFSRLDYDNFTSVRSKNGNFAYIKDAYRANFLPFLLPLNFSTSIIWSDSEVIQFSEFRAKNELDILLMDGLPIGWILRDNADSLGLLQSLNNLPISI